MVLLFSTDIEQDPKEIYQFYKLRFQVEFIFRDAKQFTGLADCQARDGQKRCLSRCYLAARQKSGGRDMGMVWIFASRRGLRLACSRLFEKPFQIHLCC